MSTTCGTETDECQSLKSQIDSLRNRIKELEEENAKLSSQLSSCSCRKIKDDLSASTSGRVVDVIADPVRNKSRTRKKKGYNAGTIEHCPTRYVALRVMYFGERFYGFASEAQLDPTVEGEIFKALEKTRLLVGDKKTSMYSRCGRTDKGVSSVGQVIALLLRSKVKEPNAKEGFCHGVCSEQDGEIDYVRMLNRALPKDIRVTGWCPVPVGFSARFSCLSREYKYFFWKDDLDILAMESAGKRFVGEHDFRNFCKMDAVNVHNYRRQISSFALSPCNNRLDGNQLWEIKFRGSAFLWHQVRCMVAVLFMISQGFESPDVVDTLLDIEKTPRKPQYAMAPENPLILHSCEFEDLSFKCSSDAWKALCLHLENECRAYELRAAIFHEALMSCNRMKQVSTDPSSLINSTTKKIISHSPLMSRPTEPSYEERRTKLNQTVESEAFH